MDNDDREKRRERQRQQLEALGRAEERMKGHEKDPCVECGNFMIRRNGATLVCDECGWSNNAD